MSPRRLPLSHLALALLCAGVLGALWRPMAGVAGICILLGLILGLIALALYLIDLFQRS